MLNILAKSLLASTSLSPVLGTVAIRTFERGEPWTSWIGWLLAAVSLAGLCWAMLAYATANAQSHLLTIEQFERTDHEVLTFLFIYLLPFVLSDNVSFATPGVTSMYILTLIIVATAHVGAFHFNPVMGLLFRYRFYAVKNDRGVSTLLISKIDLHRTTGSVQTVKLAHNVYLHTGTSNV